MCSTAVVVTTDFVKNEIGNSVAEMTGITKVGAGGIEAARCRVTGVEVNVVEPSGTFVTTPTPAITVGQRAVTSTICSSTTFLVDVKVCVIVLWTSVGALRPATVGVGDTTTKLTGSKGV